jgi:hypothetical protein
VQLVAVAVEQTPQEQMAVPILAAQTLAHPALVAQSAAVAVKVALVD